LIDGADIVVDVGAVYDPERRRFDHHQKTFVDTLNSLRPGKEYPDIRLSSAGLVYHHYGRRVIANLIDAEEDGDSALLDTVFDKVYESFVKEIDAIDNGVNICDNPKYEIHTNLSSRVKFFLPQWNEESNDEILDGRFAKAMTLVGSEFVERVKYYGNIWWPVRLYVKQAIDRRLEVDPSGEVIDLTMAETNQSFPWKEHFFSLEPELKIENQVKFVLFPDSYGKWRVQGVPLTPNSFALRVPLFKDWQGLRDKELETASGIEGTTFVHASGFIGGNATRAGALLMATKTLKLSVASS
jgi:uncharacterized UPF0160 family protein